MLTLTLCISDIVGADRDRRGIVVRCVVNPFPLSDPDGERLFEVTVSANGVHVLEVTGDHVKPGDVLVSTTLVDATRRLFGLVGDV